MTTTYEYLGDYINGEFVKPQKTDGSWSNKSPGDLTETVFAPSFSYDAVDSAVLSACSAFVKWRKLTHGQRAEYILKLKDVYTENKERLAEAIARETGKPHWEALGEAGAMIAKIDVTLNHSMKLVTEERIENALPQVDGVIHYKPRGVMAVIGPFNFPGHLANGHIIPALTIGNTVVFKPSEKTPYVGQLMAELFDKAGFPKGVFNLLQGVGESGKRLVAHNRVDGVLFTGSYDVGLRIKEETIQQYWKILALEMGGKNSSIIWEDANLEKAVYETVVGAFLTTGQRCSCTSKIVLHKSIQEKFLKNFHAAAKKLKIGHWKENPFMGPLISEDSVEKYLRFQQIAEREGAETLMRGKALELKTPGYYVTPSINVVEKNDPKSVYQKSEIFGPNVCVYTVDDFDEAIQITNTSGFGLVASVFTKRRELYEKAWLEARVGLLNWNRTTNGASSRLPFGGMGKSGNDRPSAHFAVQYCSVPVSSLEDQTDFNPDAVFPGVDYEFK
ncbi:MAG: succinylglutamate-semialdehyde dehydrogenase [Bdellovibrionales bacterium]